MMQFIFILALLPALIAAAKEKPETKPAENEHKWSSYLIQKLNLHRCLLLSAKIHYLNRLKAEKSKEEAETKEASNEVTIQLATLKHKYRVHGCVELREGTNFLRAVVSVFSEMLALPPSRRHQKHDGQLKPAFETFPETQDNNVEVVPNDEGAQESGKPHKFPLIHKKPTGDKDKKPAQKPADDKDTKPAGDKDTKPAQKPADDKNTKPADDKDTKPADEKDPQTANQETQTDTGNQ